MATKSRPCLPFLHSHRTKDADSTQKQEKHAAGLRYNLTAQCEGCIERRSGISADDVRPDSQPVRSQVLVANPFLEVGGAGGERGPRRDDGPGRREPEEVAVRQLHLGHEEVVIGGQAKGLGEEHVELDFLPRDGAVAAGVEAGARMDPLRTELFAVKLELMIPDVNVRLPAEALRSPNSTSEGELTRVGTCGVLNVGGPEVRPTSESMGKTR